ncbi:MAG: VWA domain-containing protein [Proteobacteria bacterium]|nr:VWA domain-containing protein [Pseudomonadota bacterium]MBU1059575.1 VWA domain-containing protein [Pseudomonadota bacterium]
MKLAALSEHFYHLVSPDIPNEWDVEEVMEPYTEESETVCEVILDHIPVIWPVSHSLCYDFLRQAPEALKQLNLDQLPYWVGVILDIYENDGLRAAQRFMENEIENHLSRLAGSGGLALTAVEKRLLPYIRGIANEELQIGPARETYTDTSTLYVPEELNLYPDNEQNFLLYKLIFTYQWGYIACGSFLSRAPEGLPLFSEKEDSLWLREFLDSFTQPRLARDIYHLLESIRVKIFLNTELPGLMRAVSKLPFPLHPPGAGKGKAETFFSSLQQALTGDQAALHIPLRNHLTACECQRYLSGKATAEDSARLIPRLYATFEDTDQKSPSLLHSLPFQGRLKLKAVETARKVQKEKMGEQIIDQMATYLQSLSQEKLDTILKDEERDSGKSGLAESDISMIMDSEFAQTANQEKTAPLLVTINNEELELPLELDRLARKFFDEFNQLPTRFITSAAGKAGEEMLQGNIGGQGEDEPQATGPVIYDEWDYRRQGYRKNWCSLQFKELPPVHSSFIRNTLDKYHGLTLRLRHQFEMMRSQERFVKRQREGNDIDFDALVESLSDTQAGLPSSDRLFIRLKRDIRDIAVLFLVDMSNSTSGWVNTALKESLVLMSEAIEVLGDRYAIYGFSGMRRSRCELFHIKHLTEPYGARVKERISSIGPCEYTRMGPPIRHATALLREVDAKVRLIITLSDGKPEDYDDYKGDYAIEDTRHALLEAKVAGIHPFCITIDHQAHDYMEHMYGPANYIFVDNVRKLPLRMPEIYRALTS